MSVATPLALCGALFLSVFFFLSAGERKVFSNGSARSGANVNTLFEEAQPGLLSRSKDNDGWLHVNGPGLALMTEEEEVTAQDESDIRLWELLNTSSGHTADDVKAVKEWAMELGDVDTAWVGNDENPAQRMFQLAVESIQFLTTERGHMDIGDDLVLLHIVARRFHSMMGIFVSADFQYKQIATDRAAFLWIKVKSQTPGKFLKHEKVNSFTEEVAAFYEGVQARKSRSRQLAVIFTCAFGSGHHSAAAAVRQYLDEDAFTVDVLDTTRHAELITKEMERADWMFNEVILRNQLYMVHNVLDKAGQIFHGTLQKLCPSPTCDSDRKSQFRKVLLRRLPNVIISVYHMDLIPLLELATELGNLPYLHVATDMDIKMHEVFTKPPLYPRFLVAVPFDLPRAWQTIAPLDQDSQTVLTGYPVRLPFLTAPDAAASARAKSEHYPADTIVVLVMSGGGGQNVPFPFDLAAHGLGKDVKVHVVIVAGGDNQAESRLAERLHAKPVDPTLQSAEQRRFFKGEAENVTVEVARDPANTRSDKPFFVAGEMLQMLMDTADIIITKPGGSTTAEVAFRGVPAVFDATHGLFHWEAFTVGQFEDNDRGVTLVSSGAESLAEKCLAALRLGRSTVLVERRSDHKRLDSQRNIVNAVHQVMGTKCEKHCRLFEDDAEAAFSQRVMGTGKTIVKKLHREISKRVLP